MTKIRGATIVELLLYMGLLSIFLVSIFNVFAQILDTKNRSESVSLVQRNGNFLLTKLSADIRAANTITTPSIIGTTATSIVLKIGNTTNSYLVNNGRLQLNSQNLNDVDTTIINFLVKNIGNSLQVGFTIVSNVIDSSGVIKSQSYQTTFSHR